MTKEHSRDYVVRRVDGGSLQALTEFPRYFEIETVNACNARCPMCTIDDWDRRDGLMKDDLFASLVEQIGERAAEVKRVQLFRDGEPLLDKKLAPRTAAMKAAGVKKVGISTNAALLTPAKSRDLLSAGMDEVILSFDSLDAKTYEAIRVNLDFEEVLGNIEDFIRIRDEMGSTCQAWVRMIRQESNAHEWPAFQAYWRKRLKATDRVDYRNIHNWGTQLVNFRPVNVAETAQPCIALWSLMVIFANGDVPMCNVDYNNTHPLGNLREHSIVQLWNGEEQNRRRAMHMRGARDYISMCNGCTVWSEEKMREAA